MNGRALVALPLLLVATVAACQPPAGEPGPPSELVVEVLRGGDGEAIARGDVAAVHYTGWLYDADAPDNKGREFDSSRPRSQPITFTLGSGQVIAGWERGVEGMRVGEQRRLLIPPDLAYGDRGAGGGAIPPGATLIFDVELTAIQ